MNIRIITASAGTGKTTRLSEVLDEAIGTGRVRPEGIVATTFTRQAAAELVERARARLLASGRGREAHQLLAARIGTVNAVCGSLVADFAFELGLSPTLRVLDEKAAEVVQKHALAEVVDPVIADELQRFPRRFDSQLDWHHEVGNLIAAARANGLGAADLRSCATRSVETMDACLGPCTGDAGAIDQVLLAAIDGAIRAIDLTGDTTVGTRKYVELLSACRRSHARASLRWGDWARLMKDRPTRKSAPHALPVAAAAAAHLGHPGLRAEMHRLTRLLFQIAADGLAAYQRHKRDTGVVDFIDQETLALDLLRRPDVRAALHGQLDLVLVDEFQDTSPLQLAIFLELAGLAARSVWVGDPKQAIYGFRGTDPALMDAAIESLTSPSSDPELVLEAVETVARTGTMETLSTSYRSRPELVSMTSEIFARAFAAHGMPEERTRLSPFLVDEPPGLGPILEHWPLIPPGRASKTSLAACAASGVRDLLHDGTRVRDRQTGIPRPATAGDIAVLCRTNEQCQTVAEALAQLDIPAVVPRMGLLTTAEGQLTRAALRLWIDPRDALAAAILARLTTYATDLDALVDKALATPGRDAFAAEPAVVAILGARNNQPDLDPSSALAAIIDATDLRTRCAAWGNATQRLANLDALGAQAGAYVAEAEANRDPPTLTGLLRHFDDLVEEWGWTTTRTDSQALQSDQDAVTISTWHRAKGLEWPVAILYGLEAMRDPQAHGVHVVSDRRDFDIEAPLSGRWIRYWPNPYTTANQGGPIKEAHQQSPTYTALVDRAHREALRLLYVGWTRARDRLILAASTGKLTSGLLGALEKIDPALINDPGIDEPQDCHVHWADQNIPLRVRPAHPAPPVTAPPRPGQITIGRPPPPIPYPPARLSPSTVAPRPCELRPPIEIGPRLAIQGSPDMERLGNAVHAFLAADRPELDDPERVTLAANLLTSHQLQTHIAPELVAEAGARLTRWLDDHLAATRLHREWPVTMRLPTGTVLAGTADLVARVPGGLALIDHKTFPGSPAAALARLPRYAGQLAAYADALEAATNLPVISLWIHLPVVGHMVEIRLLAAPRGAVVPLHVR